MNEVIDIPEDIRQRAIAAGRLTAEEYASVSEAELRQITLATALSAFVGLCQRHPDEGPALALDVKQVALVIEDAAVERWRQLRKG